jgi:hypothetical protein
VHSKEQHTENEESRFDLIIMSLTYISKFYTLQVGVVFVTKILKSF